MSVNPTPDAGDNVQDTLTLETGRAIAAVSNWGVMVLMDYRKATQHQRNYVWQRFANPGDPTVENRLLVLQQGPIADPVP